MYELLEVARFKNMPFKSKAQVKWMFANKPKMAKKWAKHTKSIKRLPKKKKSY